MIQMITMMVMKTASLIDRTDNVTQDVPAISNDQDVPVASNDQVVPVTGNDHQDTAFRITLL